MVLVFKVSDSRSGRDSKLNPPASRFLESWNLTSDYCYVVSSPRFDNFLFFFCRTGFYIYMEASDLLKGQEIRLESKEFFTPICLHFHYHMYGKDANELRLEQRNLTDNSTKVVWSVKGEQEDYWHSGLQDFYGEHYRVMYTAHSERSVS